MLGASAKDKLRVRRPTDMGDGRGINKPRPGDKEGICATDDESVEDGDEDELDAVAERDEVCGVFVDLGEIHANWK